MASKQLWGWDSTNKVWVPLAVDANGYVKVDLANVNLNDLADVSVAAPADDDLFYYDTATSLWKARKLVDADIPAAIARDTEVATAVSDHAALATGVHGAGAYHLLHTRIFDPIAGGIFGQTGITAAGPFTAKIHAAGTGGLTATNVPYDGEANEGSVIGIYVSAANWGRMMLYNSTRGTYRKIVTVNTTTNAITTDSSTDSWADNDDITTQSQVNATAGYVDMDVSAEIPASATSLYLFAQYVDNAVVARDNYRHLFFHPYETYDSGLRWWLPACLAGDVAVLAFVQKIISQKFTMFARNPSTDQTIVVSAKGYF